MICDSDGYLYLLDDRQIREVSGKDLTDEQCEQVAYELDAYFDYFICRVVDKLFDDHKDGRH